MDVSGSVKPDSDVHFCNFGERYFSFFPVDDDHSVVVVVADERALEILLSFFGRVKFYLHVLAEMPLEIARGLKRTVESRTRTLSVYDAPSVKSNSSKGASIAL